ncbi:MAG: glycosyltransferase family 2 protein [Candidatus Omnitrophica bacterium]|nr:glycosyltransferase family 2 protein [Candidatus Omnitrophota bacterium]
MKNNRILVTPVAYNECVKLKNVIERFLLSPVRKDVDYMVVDDGSTDGTSELIQQYSDQGVMHLKHEQRQGVGSAIRTAIKYACENHYEILVIMAGNDKDNPEEIPQLIDPILKDNFDFVQGSRYKGGKGIGGDMPFYRKIATRIHPLLMSAFTGKKLTDTTNGFRAFRLAIFEDNRINIDQDWLDKYELEPYLLFKAIALNYRFTEAFVTKIYPPKKLGYTKMKPLIGWWSILRPVFYLGFRLKK